MGSVSITARFLFYLGECSPNNQRKHCQMISYIIPYSSVDESAISGKVEGNLVAQVRREGGSEGRAGGGGGGRPASDAMSQN
jgi:hypothetical protein